MRIRREEAGRALEILEDYHGRLFAPEDSETRSSIEQIIRIFKSELFQALLDIHDVYEVSVKNGDTATTGTTTDEQQQQQQQHLQAEALSLSTEQFNSGVNGTEQISASDVQKLFSPGKLNELLGAVLQHDKNRQLEHQQQQQQQHSKQNNLQVNKHQLSASSSPLPLESIGEPAESEESESSSSNFETVHDYYPNGQLQHHHHHHPKGTPEIVEINNGREVHSPVPVLQSNGHQQTNGFNGIVRSSSSNGVKNSSESIAVVRSQSRQSSNYSPVPESGFTTEMSSNSGPWEYEEVIIDRAPTGGLGFSIAGGINNPHVPDDYSIFITKVIPDGPASLDGRLQVNDIILKVNDISLVNVQHATAVEALQFAGSRVHLFVKRRKLNLPPSVSAPANIGGEIVHVELLKTGSKGLGFSIAGGIGNQHVQGDNGIYITKIMENGAAQLDGRIEVGDKLVAVNDILLENIKHEDAVAALKDSPDNVLLTIRKPPARIGSNGSSNRQFNPVTLTPLTLNSKPSTRTSLQSLPVGGDFVTFDERSQTLPMPRHTNNVQQQQQQQHQQSNNVYNHSQSRLTRSSEGVDMPDNMNVRRDVRKVILTKSSSGLGFNIVGGEDGDGIFISFILAGGAADLSEQIYRGDQVLEVNGINLRDATHHEAAQALKNGGNTVTLLLVYKPEEFRRYEAKIQELREQQSQMQSHSGAGVGTLRTSHKKTLYVRALFDYEPARDSGLPSRGLMFRFGDILHVTNASDDEWWQARRVLADGKDDTQIGIIPSKRRVERRERARVKSVKFHGSNDYSDGTGRYSSSGTLDRKKKNFSFSRKFPFMKSRESSNEDLFSSTSCDHLDSQEAQPDRSSISGSNTALEDIREDGVHILSYEIVHVAEISYVRPVVILGPLKERINDDLISDYPERFGSCVPHTTRPKRDGEVDGRDYFFVASREMMELEIEQGFFIEAGQYRDNLYGTSLASVKELAITQGKHCILDVSAAAIRRLRCADLLPISILIRPRSIEQLREWDKRIQDEEARKQFERALQIETEFGELFTAIVSADTPEEIYAKVKLVINDNYGPNIWVPSKNQRI